MYLFKVTHWITKSWNYDKDLCKENIIYINCMLQTTHGVFFGDNDNILFELWTGAAIFMFRLGIFGILHTT